MQIIFILAALVGLIMLFFGLKWTLLPLKRNEIVEFPLVDGIKEFEIIKSGLYAVCIVGGGYVKNSGSFSARIIQLGE